MTLNSAHRLPLLCCGLFVWLLLTPTNTFAKPLTKDRVDVFQLKSITKKQRHEFTPQFALTLNDPFVQTITLGLSYAFHLNEGLAFELTGRFAFSSITPLIEQMRTSGDKAILRPNGGGSADDEFNPALSFPQVYASGSLVWSPFVGKFTLGAAIVDMNIYLLAGAGYVMSNRANQQQHLPSANFGIGFRFFLAKWLSLRIDVRDVIYGQQLQTLSRPEVNMLVHNVFVNIGFGIFLPFTPNYG